MSDFKQEASHKPQKASGVYRFYEETIRAINMTAAGFENVVMNPRDLEKGIKWIKKNGKQLSGGAISVESRLLQPGNKEDKNSLYNFALKAFPKGGAEQFCKDLFKMVRQADDMRKAMQKEEDGFLLKKT